MEASLGHFDILDRSSEEIWARDHNLRAININVIKVDEMNQG